MTELIITEKPKAAQQIAAALADKKPTKKSINGVPYYELSRNGKDIIVASAVGHLFGLAEKNKKGWRYPVFEVEWKSLSEISPSNKFSGKYVTVLKKLSKEADSFVVATDYDIEGELIGLNAIRFAAKKKDAKRMKFSTLTKPDLEEAYNNLSPTLDWGQANAGESRHILDWYWGINLSRALTTAIKTTGRFKLLSSGRVQGPALKVIVDREKEIQAFKAVPYWEIELKAQANSAILVAMHKNGKFWDNSEAKQAYDKANGKNAIVKSLERDTFTQPAPHPFDLTSLQLEAYKTVRIPPKETLEIAQDLYTSGFISYPRTSSQQLPPNIGYKRILTELSKNEQYETLAKTLLKKTLAPRNGKKTDPAHPAIYPTGIKPGHLDVRAAKLYDLIVCRFMATFGEPATRENQTITILLGTEPFIAAGTRTTVKGWHQYYETYLRLSEVELPVLKEGAKLAIESLTVLSKETQPPKRYTAASIIKDLEKRNLGTKATRAQIVETLYDRGYVQGQPIQATNLGLQTVDTLLAYAPDVLDEELTRHFEVEMDEIRENKKKPIDVLNEAKEVLEKTLAKFKKNEKEIGSTLQGAHKETEDKQNTIGKCMTCSSGTLMIKRGKFGRFIACSTYPECKTTFKLPSNGLVKNSTAICQTCSYPMVLVIRKAKKPQEVCINLDCPSKNMPKDFKEHSCPSCKEGTVILRRSIYGGFMGCNKYPKCRYIEKIKAE